MWRRECKNTALVQSPEALQQLRPEKSAKEAEKEQPERWEASQEWEVSQKARREHVPGEGESSVSFLSAESKEGAF